MPVFSKSILDHADLDQLFSSTTTELKEVFGCEAEVVVAAPGRVNLIGGHVDYNDGFVLPLAVGRYVVIAAARTNSLESRLRSVSLGETGLIRLGEPRRRDRNGWMRYVEGVSAGFERFDRSLPSFDAVVGSSVPFGGGLSSSAALEVAIATLFEQLTGCVLDPSEKAMLCQTAEHEFAGVPCGIMDQFSSVFGQQDHLMLIDCRSQTIERIPFDSNEVVVLVTDSKVKHNLATGEYAKRRNQCDRAKQKIGRSSWRDISHEDIERNRDELGNVEYRRSLHVVSEISRTAETARLFRNRDWDAVGKMMYDSHRSMRDHYDVSCHELDLLVSFASEIGLDGGVFGSRMTGGGFGGCTVSLVSAERIESIVDVLSSRYEAATGIRPSCFVSRPARGAHVIKNE